MNAFAADSGFEPRIVSFDYSVNIDDARRGSGDWGELAFETIRDSDRESTQEREPLAEPAADSGSKDFNPEILKERFDAGWQKGMEEGRLAERSAQMRERAEEERRRKEQIIRTLQEFSCSQSGFFEKIEREVVDLALGIAARILRHEAQMDPLLLTGAVRIALGQLGQTTEVRIRVPEPDAALWREVFAHAPNLALRPEVIEIAGMATGECTIETRHGRVDLGLRAQLAEIEKGFFDRGQLSRGDESSEVKKGTDNRP